MLATKLDWISMKADFVCLGPVLQYVLVKIDHSSYTIKINK